jgi:transposase
MNRSIVRRELIRHGATRAQAKMYCDLVDLYVDLSKQDRVTERHHILPRQSGWWKKYEHAKWNIATVSWQLHGSLHAVLCHIFPTNEALFKAARITSSRFRGNEKKLRLKPEIIRLYQAGKSSLQIAKKFGLAGGTVRNWVRDWGVVLRTLNEATSLRHVGDRKSKHKNEIIRLYQAGRNTVQVGKNFGLTSSTIFIWLREWGIPLRTRTEAISLRQVGNRKSKRKDEIILLYRAGKSADQIGKKFGLSESTILRWLREWGFRIRNGGRPVELLKAA